nr:T9SS type A sorting domain-containing protein [Candidatus Cloacimonadota bacterium]
SYVYLRLSIVTDGSVDDPGWWVDEIKILSSVGAGNGSNLPPLKSELYHNYPNPFNPTTTIKYQLAAGGNVDLSVFNVRGQKVKTLAHEMQEAGAKTYYWNGFDDHGHPAASGVYFYKLQTDSFEKSFKMILLK